MRKSATLDRFAAYFDVGAATLRPVSSSSWDDVTPAQLTAVMEPGVRDPERVPTVSSDTFPGVPTSPAMEQAARRRYLLKPVRAFATYERKGKREALDSNAPAQRVHLRIDAVATRLTSSHLRAAFIAAERLERDARRAPHAHLRPTSAILSAEGSGAGSGAREWWRFAVAATTLRARREGTVPRGSIDWWSRCARGDGTWRRTPRTSRLTRDRKERRARRGNGGPRPSPSGRCPSSTMSRGMCRRASACCFARSRTPGRDAKAPENPPRPPARRTTRARSRARGADGSGDGLRDRDRRRRTTTTPPATRRTIRISTPTRRCPRRTGRSSGACSTWKDTRPRRRRRSRLRTTRFRWRPPFGSTRRRSSSTTTTKKLRRRCCARASLDSSRARDRTPGKIGSPRDARGDRCARRRREARSRVGRETLDERLGIRARVHRRRRDRRGVVGRRRERGRERRRRRRRIRKYRGRGGVRVRGDVDGRCGRERYASPVFRRARPSFGRASSWSRDKTHGSGCAGRHRLRLGGARARHRAQVADRSSGGGADTTQTCAVGGTGGAAQTSGGGGGEPTGHRRARAAARRARRSTRRGRHRRRPRAARRRAVGQHRIRPSDRVRGPRSGSTQGAAPPSNSARRRRRPSSSTRSKFPSPTYPPPSRRDRGIRLRRGARRRSRTPRRSSPRSARTRRFSRRSRPCRDTPRRR